MFSKIRLEEEEYLIQFYPNIKDQQAKHQFSEEAEDSKLILSCMIALSVADLASAYALSKCSLDF